VLRVVAITTDRREALTLSTTLNKDPSPGGGNKAIERTDRAKRVAEGEQLVELVNEGAALQQFTTRGASQCVACEEVLWRGRLTTLDQDLGNEALQRITADSPCTATHRARTASRSRRDAHSDPPPGLITVVVRALKSSSESARHAHRSERASECGDRCGKLNDCTAATLDQRINRNKDSCDRGGHATCVVRINAQRRIHVTLLASSECCTKCAVKADALLGAKV
jgi:hypothetical protein